MSTSSVTEYLHAWRAGDEGALDEVLARVHRELQQLARQAMRGERRGHTLQPTALVHEAFLRLMGAEVSWRDRAHFLAVSATIMRRILIDHARAVGRDKRGGKLERLSLRSDDAVSPGPDLDLLELDSALTRLAQIDPVQCRMVEYAYFAGLSYPEIAQVLGVSRATVGRELSFAKAWLRKRMQRGRGGSP